MGRHHVQDKHQQEVEELVNDLLSYPPPFVSTRGSRRRRQRPSRAASCIPLDAPVAWAPSRDALWNGEHAYAPSSQRGGGHAHKVPSTQHSGARKPPIFERSSTGSSIKRLKDESGASRSPTPTSSPMQRDSLHGASRGPTPTPSPMLRDSLHAHSRRKLLSLRSTHKPDLDSPLAHPHQVAASTSVPSSSPTRRSQSEPLPTPSLELLHRTPSLRNMVSGKRCVRLKAVAHALIATLPTRACKDDVPPSPVQRQVTSADLAVLTWEHQERLALAARQREERNLRVQRQAASKFMDSIRK